MAIIVQCSCGKKFKAKDSLAGKRVRCPGCQNPVTVGSEDGPRKGKSGPASSGFDPQEALARYEAAQKKKQETAAEEAARQEEKNKLIASYDQLVGKKKKKDQKKDELAESKPKKATVVVKAADAGGTVLANPLVKYLIIAGLLAAGAFGSVKLVQFIVNYTSQEVVAQQRIPETQIRELDKEVRTAALRGDAVEAQKQLDKIIEIYPDFPTKRKRDYDDLVRVIERAKSKGD
ncbi:MAG: hypothetical protein H6818_05520 [Phycisphaerales bacterium]|nr:hypothetical protein [Phycisphaerales bacterium]